MATDLLNVRKAFRARPGYYILDIDYSQIENRVSAAFAGEYPLLKGFVEGVDFYSNIYAQMAGIPFEQVTKSLRQIGKIIVLSQNYGAGAYSTARQLKTDVKRAQELIESLWKGLPATKNAKLAMLEKARRQGGIHSFFGRWMPLPNLDHFDRMIKAKEERKVWSSLVQGSSADWMKIAMIRCWRGLRDRDVHPLLTVHDELVFEVGFGEPFKEIVWIIREAMEFKVPTLPVDAPIYPSCKELYPGGFFVPAEPTFGPSWGEQYDLEDKIKKNPDGTEKVIPGFRTYAKQHGWPIDFDTFRDPKPDFFTQRSLRAVSVKSGPVAKAGLQAISEAMHVADTDPYMPVEVVARICGAKIEEEGMQFRYPCIVVKVPPLDEIEAAYLAKAATLAEGDHHVFVSYRDQMLDLGRTVDPKTLQSLLSRLPRVGSKVETEVYTNEGRLVKLAFA